MHDRRLRYWYYFGLSYLDTAWIIMQCWKRYPKSFDWNANSFTWKLLGELPNCRYVTKLFSKYINFKIIKILRKNHFYRRVFVRDDSGRSTTRAGKKVTGQTSTCTTTMTTKTTNLPERVFRKQLVWQLQHQALHYYCKRLKKITRGMHFHF